MKQILITKNPNIKALYGTEITFRVADKLTLARQVVTEVRFDAGMTLITGKGSFDMIFKPAKNLAQVGVILVGAYREEDEIVAYFQSVVTDVTLGKGDGLLVGTLVEPVTYRQVEMSIAQGTVDVVKSQEGQAVNVEPPKKRGGRRKKN